MQDDDVIRCLERISIHSGTITTRALADVHPEVRDLSVSQYRIFALVASSPVGLRMLELAQLASTRPQATTRLVQRLEAKHLVWTERGALADRRAVVVRTTDAGTRAWDEISIRRRELLGEALSRLSLSPGAAAMLDEVARALEGAARSRIGS
jgi:DNA-binding MarR family transcriptional regulator